MPTEKKVAVTGASGRLGRPTVEILSQRGHKVVPISRTDGVDVITGEGLAEALEGVETIIDAATGPTADGAAEFFETSVRNLQQVGAEQGVKEVIAVSIIGTDHFEFGYNAAKAAQERAHLSGPVPARILRSAQFHEFVDQLLAWTTQGDVAYLPPMRTQLVAARTVAEALADLVDGAEGAPLGNPVAEIAGPRPETLPEVAGLVSDRRGDGLRIEVSPLPDDTEGLHPAGALLPGPIAKLAGPSFEEWLGKAQG